MADGTGTSPDRTAVAAKLQELGMTQAGVQQLLDGIAIVAPDDRRLLADLVLRLLSPTISAPSVGDSLAAATEPGTSKVSTRIVAENFD